MRDTKGQQVDAPLVGQYMTTTQPVAPPLEVSARGVHEHEGMREDLASAFTVQCKLLI